MRYDINELEQQIAVYMNDESTFEKSVKAYEYACEFIERFTGCKRWTSEMMIDFLCDGETYFSDERIKYISRNYNETMVLSKFVQCIRKLGYKFGISVSPFNNNVHIYKKSVFDNS